MTGHRATPASPPALLVLARSVDAGIAAIVARATSGERLALNTSCACLRHATPTTATSRRLPTRCDAPSAATSCATS